MPVARLMAEITEEERIHWLAFIEWLNDNRDG